jgi:uncharacterized membrane protein
MNPDSSGNTEDESLRIEVAALRARVRSIEDALHRRGVVLEARAPEFAPRTPQAAEQPPLPGQRDVKTETVQAPAYGMDEVPAANQIPAQLFAASNPPASQEVRSQDGRSPGDHSPGDHSLESRIGSQWFNRIGILALLIAAAWFLKYAIDNHWIGPLGRVLIGLVSGAALIGWSERFRGKGYTAFSYSLKAVGSGVLYLSLWAAFSLFHLLPATAAFGAMIVVTAFNGFMAWAQDAELLALYAIVGGLSTPLLLSTGENHEVALLSYLLLLDLAVLILVTLKPWSRLLFGAFTGTTLIFLGWDFAYYTEAQFARTSFFVLSFFLIFAFAPRLVRVKVDDSADVHGWDVLALVLLPVANAVVGFLAFYGLLDRVDTQGAGPWLAVAFAAFYLLLLRLPAGGILRPAPAALASLHLAAVVVFLTIAIPLKTKGRWLTVGWLAEGAALLWVAARAKSLLLRVLALGCLVLGLVALLVVNPDTATTPIFNERFGTYCVAIAVFALAAWIANIARSAEAAQEAEAWQTIAVAASLLVNGLILLAVTLEIYNYWSVRDLRAGWAVLEANRIVAEFSYSAWIMLFGAILLAIGFARRSAFLRWQGLVLLAVSVGKVFLVDMGALSQGYRILSFLGLGALLLAVSFVYQRDWLNLRGAKPAEPVLAEPAESEHA